MIESVVYFAQCKDFIKIGWCRKHNFEGKVGNVKSELQRGNPFPITFLGIICFESEEKAKDHERNLHTRFNHLSHRNEWFHKKSELIDYIREHAESCINNP